MDDESSLRDWPQRWHQIVAEYNTSFERQQNKMREYFENRFDHIRKDNDGEVRQVRRRRDECGQRLCDLIDQHGELSDSLHGLKAETQEKAAEDSALDRELASLEALSCRLANEIERARQGLRDKGKSLDSQLIQLSTMKSAIRYEIRDLTGYLSMSKRMSAEGDTKGAHILATVRRSLKKG
jgi:chromosome segregation ATPase